jgi:hypothetical protein
VCRATPPPPSSPPLTPGLAPSTTPKRDVASSLRYSREFVDAVKYYSLNLLPITWGLDVFFENPLLQRFRHGWASIHEGEPWKSTCSPSNPSRW